MAVSKSLLSRLRTYTYNVERKDMKTNQSNYRAGTLMAKKNRSIAIIEATARRTYVVIEYIKITTNEFVSYKVIPMEWKYRRLKIGRRKVLYAQDMGEGFQIKSFVHSNIQRVLIGKQKVTPMGGYPVKILVKNSSYKLDTSEKI